MKTKLIPAINSQNLSDIKNKISLLKTATSYFHLDVASIETTGYQTWHDYQELEELTDYFFDLHLMIKLKPQEIFKWSKKNIKNLILHLEYTSYPDGLLRFAKKTKKLIYLSWPPQLEFDFIKKYLNFVNGLLILGVEPGKSGQKFLETTYQRIALSKKYLKSHQKLMIDGGLNKENLKKILTYQPDIIVMASAIYNASDPLQEYLTIQNLISNN
jgi:ribulose-phosphate 3-epimerase